ncbi:MAG TPA: sigma 54-interacting transcriptional regulator [Gammaproteobacteria bacterium]|nr:sigma 54-interacting transcriptional regulator [Gammaproteobacteria bacterium]
MERQRIIYLKPPTASALLDEQLVGAEWEVTATGDVDTAALWSRDPGVCVGLIHFEEVFLGARKHCIEDLMAASPAVEWIGVLPKPLLDPAIRSGLVPGFLFDYHTLPVDLPRLLHTIGHACGMANANRRAPALASPPSDRIMVGASAAMRGVAQSIHKVAGVDAPVMITGESGTGKELAAHAVHAQSSRGHRPFQAINCGALPAHLIQSELFGHEKGAFTGAHRRHVGRIEAANGGTVFLDEIGDLSLDLQVNLLRFLQEGTIERIGNTEPMRVDVRVIAATHHDLQDAVRQGRFREDLYYRLNVLHLNVPPLRERREDIEPLAEHYFRLYHRERNRNVRGFSRQALEAMKRYDWPGNVRELVNRVRRATIMCEHRLIAPEELGLDSKTAAQGPAATLAHARGQAERQAIVDSLALTNHNISEAARRLGVARITLYRLMEKYGVGTADRSGGEPARSRA